MPRDPGLRPASYHQRLLPPGQQQQLPRRWKHSLDRRRISAGARQTSAAGEQQSVTEELRILTRRSHSTPYPKARDPSNTTTGGPHRRFPLRQPPPLASSHLQQWLDQATDAHGLHVWQLSHPVTAVQRDVRGSASHLLFLTDATANMRRYRPTASAAPAWGTRSGEVICDSCSHMRLVRDAMGRIGRGDDGDGGHALVQCVRLCTATRLVWLHAIMAARTSDRCQIVV